MTSTHQNAITPKGLLWSVNATAGVQVNVLPSLGIYVEPGMRHHFKNDRQPRSSYTDKPTNWFRTQIYIQEIVLASASQEGLSKSPIPSHNHKKRSSVCHCTEERFGSGFLYVKSASND